MYSPYINLLARMVHVFDPTLSSHDDRVARLWMESWRAFTKLGVTQRMARRWAQAFRIHDMGKIGVKRALYKLPRLLTPSEYDQIKLHSEYGGYVLGAFDKTADLAVIVRGHHERWDGTGYPDGLRGKAIPLPCRIIALYDTYSAMTDFRPYADTKTVEETLDVIMHEGGKQFDPSLTKIFCDVVRQDRSSLWHKISPR